MASQEIYSHLTCPTSYRLYKKLQGTGLLNRVIIRDMGLDLFGGLVRGVVSVPAVYYSGVLVYSGYFDVDEAVETLAKEKIPVLEDFDYSEASVLAMEGVLDSYATALWLYLTDSIESILRLRGFIEAVSRHVFYKGRSGESYDRLAREVVELYRGERGVYLERLREIVARNFVRELAWLGRDPRAYRGRVNRDYLEHLLLARAALGRIGLFMGYSVSIHRERVEEVYRYLSSSWDDISEKVSKEVGKILGDEEYVKSYMAVSRQGQKP